MPVVRSVTYAKKFDIDCSTTRSFLSDVLHDVSMLNDMAIPAKKEINFFIFVSLVLFVLVCKVMNVRAKEQMKRCFFVLKK